MDEKGRKTEQAHWDAAWSLPVRPRLPSALNVDTANVFALLRPHVKPGAHYLEVGCAPGKLLAWVAAGLKARADGVDYSETGTANCRILFKALGLDVGLFQDDFFNNHLTPASYDVVSSFGFIEHFDDPRFAVAKHIELLKPGGVALIAVPNYGKLYGRLQRWFDAPNLALHNLDIMTPAALTALVERRPDLTVKAYQHGSMSLWLVNLEKRWPRNLARLLQWTVNVVGLMQFFSIPALAPMLVLEVRRSASP